LAEPQFGCDRMADHFLGAADVRRDGRDLRAALLCQSLIGDDFDVSPHP